MFICWPESSIIISNYWWCRTATSPNEKLIYSIVWHVIMLNNNKETQVILIEHGSEFKLKVYNYHNPFKLKIRISFLLFRVYMATTL